MDSGWEDNATSPNNGERLTHLSTEARQDHSTQASGALNSLSLESNSGNGNSNSKLDLPSVILPRGGGAIRAIGEKFDVNPTTGAGSASIPIEVSTARSGFAPHLSLTYSSGAGNGIFGFGWSLTIGAVTRRTDKGLPRYRDAEDSDIFTLTGDEDLVPALERDATGKWTRAKPVLRTIDGVAFQIDRYRPRIEGSYSRIERWTDVAGGQCFWRTVSRNNVTSWYGKDERSRIFDPSAAERIFSWLLCESRDDKGNAIVYEYKAENSENIDGGRVDEGIRTPTIVASNRHIKRIKFGNVLSTLVSPPSPTSKYLFEIIFDYGEHELLSPASAESPFSPWLCRRDPFSTYRPGFEVRTRRLCRRILTFHHFPDEPSVGADCLIRSLDFTYRGDSARGEPVGSFLESASKSGYLRDASGAYTKASMPPLEFSYSKSTIGTEVRTLDAESLENLPVGFGAHPYHWLDLDGDGVSGILADAMRAWLYKRNLGGGHFAAAEVLPSIPNLAALDAPDERQTFMDLEGEGRLSLVQFGGVCPGFYRRTDDRQWEGFRPFSQLPNLPWSDKNLQFLDVTGNGRTDVVVSDTDAFCVYASVGYKGFLASERVQKVADEQRGPTVVFSDLQYTVSTADMSGDGLADLVRIRNRSVVYWPNLGYGRFGAAVVMQHAPRFDCFDSFDARRVKLADLDGSGTTDIVYVGPEGVSLFFNQSGNAWSDGATLPALLPQPTNLDDVRVADILGTGTSCLVWSSAMPGPPGRQLRFVELTAGGAKPHLLVGMSNNIGTEVTVDYAPSTKFYLQDALEGKPWVTRLHFPVHVVERVETRDLIGRGRFIKKYAYHHGFYDGIEREFQGFGMVETWDFEKLSVLGADDHSSLPDDQGQSMESSTPPVYTKAWTHTGAFLQQSQLITRFESEYFHEPGLNHDQLRASRIEDPAIPSNILVPSGVRIAHNLSAKETREAFRVFKGLILRQEVYGLDGTEAAMRPYSVASHSYAVEMLQPLEGGNSHGVFLSRARESVDLFYERKVVTSSDGETLFCDPRTSHTVTLKVDEWGNTLQSVEIHYGRRDLGPAVASQFLRPTDVEDQRKTRMTYTENRYTNAIDDDQGNYRCPLLSEARHFELVKVPLTNSTVVTNLLRASELEKHIGSLADGSFDLPFEDYVAAGAVQEQPYRRLLHDTRQQFRKDDLSGPLPLGKLESLAIPYESYTLALTTGLIQKMFVESGKLAPETVEEVLSGEGGYVNSLGDSGWWIPSGRHFYSPGPADTPAAELEYARAHFFLPVRQRTPFHTDSLSTEHTVHYDKYDLLLQESVDPLGNRNTVGERSSDPSQPIAKGGQDYRTLQPFLVMDKNRNMAMVVFDALGVIVGTAIMGKPEESKGDSFNEFKAILTEGEIASYFQNPLESAQGILASATTRLVYDLNAFYRTRNSPNPKPTVIATLMRENHVSDLAPGESSAIRHSVTYVDGFGREIQHKEQAAPGPVPLRDPATGGISTTGSQPVMGAAVDPRWVGSGWQIFNSKGQVVRQYEPFFSDTHQFDFEPLIGASQVNFYDALQRIVGVLRADHSWSKVVIGTWETERWDPNDTVAVEDPRSDVEVGAFFARLPTADYLPTWARQRHGGGMGKDEKDAAAKAAIHSGTPSRYCLDSAGRAFLDIEHNRLNPPDNPTAIDKYYSTRTAYDIQGNQREITNALGNVVVRYDYDMLQVPIHEASMESGARWALNDVLREKIYSWNSRGFQSRTSYDALRRPTGMYLKDNQKPEILVESTTYGESAQSAETRNLRGRVSLNADQAGVVSAEEYDFKGNLLRSHRQLAQEYKRSLDQSSHVPLDPTLYATSTEYDALNRPTKITSPDASVTRHAYNEARLLQLVEVGVRGVVDTTQFVSEIEYDAKGQRTLIRNGNGVTTTYEYDPLTFRLSHILTRRPAIKFPADCQRPALSGWPGCQIQSLYYTYDPVGNITHVRDDAQQTIFFDQQRVEPSTDYTYDATYRLILATGREHLGQTGAAILPTASDSLQLRVQDPRNGRAMGRYSQAYKYDAVGNILAMQHASSNGGWTRKYIYAEPSLLEPGKTNNRLSSTTVGSTTERYQYDGSAGRHGNITSTPQLSLMQWDYRDCLQASSKQIVNSGTPETTYYVYDSGGKRVRKVTEWQAAAGSADPPPVKSERIYIGGCEIYRRYDGTGRTITLERETLHVMDDKHRVAVVETRTKGEDTANSPAQLTRYQLGNNLESATLELDDTGQIISYEEYLPFGSASYQMTRSDVETPKRYRFTGKERDEESGLYYHGARYYASWIGRWINCDPAGIGDGLNLYVYVRDRPAVLTDPTGTASKKGGPAKPGKGKPGTKSKHKSKTKSKPKAKPKPKPKPKANPKPPPTDAEELNRRVGSLKDPIHTPDKSGEKLKDFDITTKVHDQAVLDVINTALDISIDHFTKEGGGTLKATRREIRKYSLDLIIEMRTLNATNSQNIIFRDADHYFAGANQEWQTRPEAKEILSAIGIVGLYEDAAAKIARRQPTADLAKYSGLVSWEYDRRKISDYKAMHEKGDETGVDALSTSGFPTSAPGGRDWAAIGREDFREDDFSVVAAPAHVTPSRITWREH